MSVKNIIAEWNDSISKGIFPFMEFQLNNNEFITAELELKRHSIYFTFNSIGNKVYLDGLTKRYWLRDKEYIHAKVALKHFYNLYDVLEHIAADIYQYIIDNGLDIKVE